MNKSQPDDGAALGKFQPNYRQFSDEELRDICGITFEGILAQTFYEARVNKNPEAESQLEKMVSIFQELPNNERIRFSYRLRRSLDKHKTYEFYEDCAWIKDLHDYLHEEFLRKK